MLELLGTCSRSQKRSATCPLRQVYLATGFRGAFLGKQRSGYRSSRSSAWFRADDQPESSRATTSSRLFVCMRIRSRSNGKRLRVRKTISRKSTSVNEGRNGWIGEWLSFNNRRSNSLASKEILLSFVSPAPTTPIFLLALWHSLDIDYFESSRNFNSEIEGKI